MKYRKKPVVIEAVQWTGLNPAECKEFTGDGAEYIYHDAAYEVNAAPPSVEIIIHTLEGDMRASVGDYIIKGVDGEFYPCKPDIFEKTYEIPKFNFPPRYIDADRLIEKLTHMGYFDDDNGDKLYETIMRFVNEDI